MKNSQNSEGNLSKEQILELPGVPGKKELNDGPVAIIECPEEIACNVCEAACPFGAIEIGKQIKNIPKIIAEKCVGCGECVSACPGLAIFTIDFSYSKDKALLSFPYEFAPVPKKGEKVIGVTRSGKESIKVEVVNVREKGEGTTIISISVPKSDIDDIRGIGIRGPKEH